MKRLLYLLKHDKLIFKSTVHYHSLCTYYTQYGYSGNITSFSLSATYTDTFSSETYFRAQLFSQKLLAYYYPCTQMAELAQTYGFIHKFYVYVAP